MLPQASCDSLYKCLFKVISKLYLSCMYMYVYMYLDVIVTAIRATTDTAGRPSRKDMEREVASGMLVTRLAESGTHWQRNRYV